MLSGRQTDQKPPAESNIEAFGWCVCPEIPGTSMGIGAVFANEAGGPSAT